MEVKFKLNIGGMEYTVTETAENHAEFIEKVSFFSDLPKLGPNGEDDLKFTYRQTPKEGHKYYSLVSDKAGKEYKLGQSQKQPGELYGKGWEDVYVPQNAGESQTQSQSTTNSGFGQTAPVVEQQAPVTTEAAPQVNTAPPLTSNVVNTEAASVLDQFGIK